MIYPVGNTFDGRRLNYCDSNCSAASHGTTDDTFARTGTVGVFVTGASPYGVVDMAGNVREWVNDFYDFAATWASRLPTRPGWSQGLTRVLRGWLVAGPGGQGPRRRPRIRRARQPRRPHRLPLRSLRTTLAKIRALSAAQHGWHL
jgi:formylglycine-generating enzyme required for sulfatase activity